MGLCSGFNDWPARALCSEPTSYLHRKPQSYSLHLSLSLSLSVRLIHCVLLDLPGWGQGCICLPPANIPPTYIAQLAPVLLERLPGTPVHRALGRDRVSLVRDQGVSAIASTQMGCIDPGQPLDRSGPSGSGIGTGRISRVKSQKDETSEGATTRSAWLVSPEGLGGRWPQVQCGLQVSSGCRRSPAHQPSNTHYAAAKGRPESTCCAWGACRGTHPVPYSTLDPVATFILRILVHVR